MKARIRRLGAAVGVLGIAGALTAFPATAATSTPEVFLGNAAGQALHLKVLDIEATFGQTTAKVTSTLNAVAEGAGQLAVLNSIQKAEVTGAGRSFKPQACGLALPVADILNLGIACSTATAEVLGGLPHAVSTAGVAGLDLSANNLIALLPVELPIGATLGTLLAPLAGTPLDPVATTVTDLVNSVLKTKTLDVKLGESTSEVITSAGKVTSMATAAAGEIKILPTPEVAGIPSLEPLVTIAIGKSSATASYDRATGVAVPTVDPTLITIKTNTALGLPPITIAPGQNQTILAGTPLESTIKIASGETIKNADGSVKAIADGVTLHLLKGISGGVLLELAHAEAGVGGALPVTVAAAAPIIPPGLELPRTGGGALIPLAGLVVLVAGFALRRTALRVD